MKKIRLSNVLEEKKEFVDEEMIYDSEFNHLDISTINWNIKIDGCKFTNCKFTHLDLEQMEWIDVIFDHCEFERVHLSSSTLCRVHFVGCRVSGLEITNSLIQDVLLQSSKGNYCNFSGSKIKDCAFTQSDFSSSSFVHCDWIHSCFDHCDLDDSEWVNTNLKGIDFSTSSISNILVSNDLLKGVIVNESQALEFVRILGLIIKSDF